MKISKKDPSKEKVYSSLTNRKINTTEYEHVLNVWNKFEMKKVKDYHNLYLKRDVLLLLVLFERTRLSWDTKLKMTKMKLDLVTGPGMYIFTEKGTKRRNLLYLQ